MDLDVKRLVYGTYKLPRNYTEFSGILSTCSDVGIEWIDTAPIYNRGISECWISVWQRQSSYKFKVATKAGKFYGPDSKLYVSNSYEEIIKSIEKSLERLKVDKLELLVLHNYEWGKTEKEIEKVVKRLLESGLIEKVGLSNFPLTISRSLVNCIYIHCLQINCFAPDVERHIYLAMEKGIECWLYRPFKKGEAIQKENKQPGEIIENLLKKYPSCKIIFGASKLNQVEWLRKYEGKF
jgi:aryl-alcohol dehydrogenase-like predicted oxidoreductase